MATNTTSSQDREIAAAEGATNHTENLVAIINDLDGQIDELKAQLAEKDSKIADLEEEVRRLEREIGNA